MRKGFPPTLAASVAESKNSSIFYSFLFAMRQDVKRDGKFSGNEISDNGDIDGLNGVRLFQLERARYIWPRVPVSVGGER
jgi:hypothetical protein